MKTRLSQGERNSDAWRRVSAYVTQRLADERQRAEKLDIDERTRRDHAVRIDELKKLLALGEEPAPDTQTDAA